MPENEAIKTADKIMNTVIYDVAVNGAIKLLQAELPFLALPIISNIFAFFVGKVADALYKNLENFVAFRIIDSQVSGEVAEYKKAVQALRESGGTNAENIEKYKQALRDLIRYRGH